MFFRDVMINGRTYAIYFNDDRVFFRPRTLNFTTIKVEKVSLLTASVGVVKNEYGATS